MNGARIAAAVGLGLLGLLWAVVIGFLTIGLAGGGHGWNSSMVSGLAGLVLLPTFGVAVGLRALPAGRILLGLVVVGALLADAALGWMTWGERYYFDKLWERGSAGVVLWAVCWFSWQIAALGLLAWTGRGSTGLRWDHAGGTAGAPGGRL
jgi:hypothetical protein